MNKRIKIFKSVLLVLLVFFATKPITGQVTIGALKDPESFSLLELVSENKKGLRLPQIETTALRDAISANFTDNDLAYGLQIFNMETNCIEYWNGKQWISLCIGSANITLKGDPCVYDPHALVPADGNAPLCTYTPVNDPACVVTSGQAYTVIATGTAYATLIVDEVTSAFSLTFSKNLSHSERSVIVRVINNCTGEFKEFIFTQEGAECPSNVNPFGLQYNTTEIGGNSGAAIVSVVNPQAGINYVWVTGGTIVNTGNYMEITVPGEYIVYGGLIGCTSPVPPKINITQNTNITSYGIPVIYATNGGILCNSSGTVTLTATNVTEPVQWFLNGKPYGSPQTSPLIVSGTAVAGEWFAVQQTGSNGSRISNKLTLTDQTANVSSIAYPVAYVNGIPLDGSSGSIVACKSGSLELKVSNPYPVGTIFEWFDNGVSIKTGTDPIIYYTVPSNKESMALSVMVNDHSGDCPRTETSASVNVTLTAPPPTTINNAASKAAICGSNPAILQAVNTSGTSYQWFKDGVLIPSATASAYPTLQTGVYTVRYSDNKGCWSMMSLPINVFQSAPLSLHWHVEPDASATVNTQESCTAVSSPAPDKYTWSSSNTAVATVTPIGDGSTASINYIATGTVTVTVTAENACGAVSLQKTITVGTTCVPITSVSITPTGTITKALDEFGSPKNSGEANTLFAAYASNGSPATSYEWYVNDQPKSNNSATFTFATPGNAGSYVVYATALNGCMGGNPAKSATVTVNVTKDNPVDISGNYRLSGKNCFDVKRSNDGTGDCAKLSSRVDDFASTKTFTYTFISNTTSFPSTGLTFEVIDDNNLIVNKSASGNVFTVTFRDDINTVAAGRDKTSALKLTIVAKYTDNTNAPKQISLDVAVQDCTCGCTVKTASGGFITFMCYNLGAAETVKTMTPMEQATTSSSTTLGTDSKVYGDLYQWGRRTDGHEKRNSAVVNISGGTNFAYDTNSQIPSTLPTHYGKFITTSATPNDWHGNSDSYKNDNLWNFSVYPANNPCPPGWRIPTSADWASMINGGVPGVAGSNVTGLSTTTGQTLKSGNYWKWNPASNGTAGWLVSPDGGVNYTLFLPSAGERLYNNGTISNMGNWGVYYNTSPGGGTMMSSTQMNPGSTYNKANGHSVRCVQE